MLITSETYTKHIHPLDKANKTIFGDGAAACLVSSDVLSNMWNAEILEFSYMTDGSGYDKLIIRNGGMRCRQEGKTDDVFEDDVFIKNDDFIYMDGRAIFDFTAFQVPKLVSENLEKNGYLIDDINLFVFHQANEYMINFVRNRCKIPADKFYIDLKDGGNTVSATIPIALKRASDKDMVKKENKILLCGFGVGLSMGAVVLKL